MLRLFSPVLLFFFFTGANEDRSLGLDESGQKPVHPSLSWDAGSRPDRIDAVTQPAVPQADTPAYGETGWTGYSKRAAIRFLFRPRAAPPSA